eukprot:5540604-Ditylum_brightwellii.AAC.1
MEEKSAWVQPTTEEKSAWGRRASERSRRASDSSRRLSITSIVSTLTDNPDDSHTNDQVQPRSPSELPQSSGQD